MKNNTTSSKFAVEVNDLNYQFSGSTQEALHDIKLQIPWNSRTLLIGSNGAGKSTLLKLLAGKQLCLTGEIFINGINPFSSQYRNEQEFGMNTSTYLGTEWCHMEIINRDIGVLELLDSIGYTRFFKQRGDELIKILEVDLEWRMHKLSDGQKRRVQLVMGLLKPFKLLLLDEVTVDLDVVARSKLLKFLKLETEIRECSVIYATHIFDGLNEWPLRLIHMSKGSIVQDVDYKKNVVFRNDKSGGDIVSTNGSVIEVEMCKSLHPLALKWLLKDQNTDL
ncbi:related to CCR4-associated factor 16 [Saccharomycodes ludwigii]|uniref:Related to CCR4-associated factor 16 n=1 Tax=Saccharomycodes ludwigii TaxID=36035 RepID=A0A376BBE2_9ASCO|nr:related to CCR4-associated factor 16 [Saccharomycodes ludwigii]